MDLPNRIATILGPHLGAITADTVARHLCAKHEIATEGPVDPSRSEQLYETLVGTLDAWCAAFVNWSTASFEPLPPPHCRSRARLEAWRCQP